MMWMLVGITVLLCWLRVHSVLLRWWGEQFDDAVLVEHCFVVLVAEVMMVSTQHLHNQHAPHTHMGSDMARCRTWHGSGQFVQSKITFVVCIVDQVPSVCDGCDSFSCPSTWICFLSIAGIVHK